MTPKKSKDAHPLLLNTHPALNNGCPMLNPDQEQIAQEFEDEAARLGVASWELTLLLIATSEKQANWLLLEAHREIAEMVDMAWADYGRLHNLPECSEQWLNAHEGSAFRQLPLDALKTIPMPTESCCTSKKKRI